MMRYFTIFVLLSTSAFAQAYPDNSPMGYEQQYMQQTNQQQMTYQQNMNDNLQGQMMQHPELQGQLQQSLIQQQMQMDNNGFPPN